MIYILRIVNVALLLLFSFSLIGRPSFAKETYNAYENYSGNGQIQTNPDIRTRNLVDYQTGSNATYPSVYNSYQSAYNPPSSSQGMTASSDRITQWFTQYDQIRRHAQMAPAERQQADHLLSQGMSILVPGDEKVQARSLLTKLVDRYQQAKQSLRQLPLIPETQQLHRGFYKYFNNAHLLFSDYLKVQENLLAKDNSTGQPIAAQLMERKKALEELDDRNKNLDHELRAKFDIPSYKR